MSTNCLLELTNDNPPQYVLSSKEKRD